MNHLQVVRLSVLSFVLLGIASLVQAQAPLPIDNITDRGTTTGGTWFRVPTTADYTYRVLLDGQPVPTGVSNWVNQVDYHEVLVSRTNVSTLAVTNRLIRFIILAAERGDTEKGLILWTPYPTVNSTAGELAGAHLDVMAPANFPAGMEIPIVAWIRNDQDGVVRGNGPLTAPGHPSIPLRRGVGSGFLAATNAAGPLAYTPRIQDLQTNKTINVDATSAWLGVSGTLSGFNEWEDNWRIHVTNHLSIPAGSSLRIAPGVIVWLDSGVNITNNGTISIEGTVEQPVVFTPRSRSQPWGGFFMMNSTSQLDANGAIFVASGAVQSGFPGHRREQPLFMVDNQARLGLTNCAAMYLAGQFFHSFDRGSASLLKFTMFRSLVQRCTTGGEFMSVSFRFLESAFIEVPYESGEYGTVIDSDYDGLYLDVGNFEFRDSLIGWVKDDGLDSGSGSGPVNILLTNCWVESAYHEGLAWSNVGRRMTNAHVVVMNSGQGIECGWSGGQTSDSPQVFASDCLSTANSVGTRHGDNYDWDYDGFLRVTNSFFLYNYRDVWGMDWDLNYNGDWNYRADQMDIQGNYLTAPNTKHPNNSIWNPATDAGRLASFMSTPPDAPVGVGLAVWTNQSAMTSIFSGVPVRLSSFTTNEVSVGYDFENAGGTTLATGTLTFAPGETVKRIHPAGFDVSAQSQVRVVLRSSVQGELTGVTNFTFTGSVPAPQMSCWVSTNALPLPRLLEGLLVKLSTPSGLPASVDYAYTADSTTLANGTLTFAPGETVKWIDPSGVNIGAYDPIQLTLSNPSGGELSGITGVFYGNPPLQVALGVASTQLDLATFTNGLPVVLNRVASNPVNVDFRCEGNGGVLTNGALTLAAGQTLQTLRLPTVDPNQHDLLKVSLANAVNAQLAAPSNVYFVRVVAAPSPLLVKSNSWWRYRDLASDPGASWKSNTFNDTGWAEGPAQLGFSGGEEQDEATLIADNNQITSYFRQTFVVEDPTIFTSLAMWLLRDDGGVVYLNGREVFRSPNLPAYPTVINYSTTTVAPNGENTIDTATINASYLQAGTNLVAVEIHQQSATSSDVSFNFSLTGQPAPPPPPQNVYWASFGGQMVLAWSAGGYVLEEADEVTGSWRLAANTSPFLVTPSVGQKFYRLRKL